MFEEELPRILIVYFSGASSTRKIALLMKQQLMTIVQVDCWSVEAFLQNETNLANYSGMILGTPVHHGAPAKLIIKFMEEIEVQKKALPLFLFNTYGLWSCNTNRIMAKKLRVKNVLTYLDRGYRSPASDGSILVPTIKHFFTFEKGIEQKIKNDLSIFYRV